MSTPIVRLRQLGTAEGGFPSETFVGGSREVQFAVRPNEAQVLYFDEGTGQWGVARCASYLEALGMLALLVHYLELDECESGPTLVWDDVAEAGLPEEGLAVFSRRWEA